MTQTERVTMLSERLVRVLNKLSRKLPDWAPMTLEMFNENRYCLKIRNTHEILPLLFVNEWVNAVHPQSEFVQWFINETDAFYFINGLVQDDPEDSGVADNGRLRESTPSP